PTCAKTSRRRSCGTSSSGPIVSEPTLPSANSSHHLGPFTLLLPSREHNRQMPILDVFMGRPLANWEEQGEQIGPSAGIPIFGLDALSSAAYGPEAALTPLIPLRLLGLHYILPVIAAIVVLLIIVYFSYRQTIAAYP